MRTQSGFSCCASLLPLVLLVLILSLSSLPCCVGGCLINTGLFERSPPPLFEELGLSPTWQVVLQRQNVYFDPAGIATDDNFAMLREAELKHGRVAMMATIGMIVGPNQGRDIGEFISDYILVENNQLPLRATTPHATAWEVLTPINVLGTFLVCGFLEIFVFVQLDPSDLPGDYGIGYFGLRNKGLHERSLISELENGRLAMLAFLAQVCIEVVTGHSVIDQGIAILSSNPAESVVIPQT